jgi:hypothetical protein
LLFFMKGYLSMTNAPIPASEPQKPTTPASTQQQTQGNPPKPADKPNEQQK